MFKLLANVKAAEASTRRERWRAYRAILERGDEATEEDRQQLAELMESLGLDVAQVERDLRALADARALKAQIADTEAAGKDAVAARKALADHNAVAAKVAKEMAEKFEGAVSVLNQAEKRHMNCGLAPARLAAIEQSFPDLFDKQPAGIGGGAGPKAA